MRMYINTINSRLIGSYERALLGIAEQASKRKTTFGEFRGIHIAIDNFTNREGITLQKRFVLWNESTQLVYYKNRNSKGRFDLLV